MEEKSTIRKIYLNQRKALSRQRVDDLSREVIVKLMTLGLFKDQEVVFGYMSHMNEVVCASLVKKLKDEGIGYAIPKVTGKGKMVYYLIKGNQDLSVGAYGILEPKKHCNEVEPHKDSLVLVPGVAFDTNKYRIGYGGGYYDRLMSDKNEALYIGLAYEAQIVSSLPVEPHDQKLAYVVTENRIIR